MASAAPDLLSIPMEVRQMIWNLVITPAYKIYLTKEGPRTFGHNRKKLFDAPPLLLVNRKTNLETSVIHKQQVTIAIIDAEITDTHIRQMGFIKRNLVTDVVFLPNVPRSMALAAVRKTWEIALDDYHTAFEITTVEWKDGREYEKRYNIVGKATVSGAKERIPFFKMGSMKVLMLKSRMR